LVADLRLRDREGLTLGILRPREVLETDLRPRKDLVRDHRLVGIRVADRNRRQLFVPRECVLRHVVSVSLLADFRSVAFDASARDTIEGARARAIQVSSRPRYGCTARSTYHLPPTNVPRALWRLLAVAAAVSTTLPSPSRYVTV